MKKSLLLLLFISKLALSQTPVIAPIANETEFSGMEICSIASLTNTGSPGYGPYFRVNAPMGVSLGSSKLFGGSVPVTDVGVFPAAPMNELIDPVTGEMVFGNEGDRLYIVRPPVGSVVSGGLALDVELCYTMSNTATVDTPIQIDVTPIYQYGDTPTGQNGEIIGPVVSFTTTPQLVEFSKSNNAPEAERPPGMTWPITYSIGTSIAPGSTLDNVIISDALPSGFILDSSSI